MEQRQLGRTGMSVSVLGLGGVFLSSVGAERQQGVQTIRRAIELGISYFDTARSYADSEEVIGEALATVPESKRPCISTKVGGWPIPFDAKSKQGLRKSFEESLRRLGVASVGGLQVHEPDRPGLFDWWDDEASADGPVWELLQELKSEQKIQFTGLGGTTAWEMGRLVETGRFDTVLTTFNYSLLWREADEAIIQPAVAHGMGIVAGTPFQQGALAQRFDDEVKNARWLSPPRRRQYQMLYELLDDLKMPMHELALRWVISDPRIATVVVGARSVREIELNVEAAEKGALEKTIIDDLDRIAALVPFRPFEEPGGPYGLPFNKPYKGPGPLQGTGVAGGITTESKK